MITLRKYWIPIVLIIILFSRLLLFSESTNDTFKVDFPPVSTLENNAPPPWVGISRDETMAYVKSASKETGIIPEFLLAIFSQETSSGKNLGSCFLFNPKIFGPGIGVDFYSGKFTSRVMKPERDVEPFLSIMKELDRNPYITAVSCPMKIGYGGAMGPMQIIPSTWILIKDRTAIALGKKVVDPWIPQDAFMGAAIHLRDLGADHKSDERKRNAACRYFSGKSCGEKKLITTKKSKKGIAKKRLVYVENHLIAGYGNSIMKKMKYFYKILHANDLAKKKINKNSKQKKHKK